MLYQYFKKGINLGGWLSQYDCNEPYSFNEQERSRHFKRYIREKNIEQIASWGLDHVRLPVDATILIAEDPSYKIKHEWLSYINKCIEWCKKYSLNLIIDLHDIKGNIYGQMDEPAPFLNDQEIQKRFISIWEYLTAAFKGIKKPVIMFELFNEISDATDYLWPILYKKTIKKIRMIDSDRFILVGSNNQNSIADLKKLDLIDDPYVFYNFHYYEPQVFTHQKAHFSPELNEYNRTVRYPDDISGFLEYIQKYPEYIYKYRLLAAEKRNDFSLMKKLFKDAENFIKYSGHELYCGEFGVINTAPTEDAAKWLLDFMRLADQYQIGHALWNYKERDFGLVDKNNQIISEELITKLFNH